jgi:uncharacterized protein (TIGR02271 family)
VTKSDRTSLDRVEERLVPEVHAAEAGRVRIQKRVVEEPEAFDVSLRHDELDVERHAADRPLEPGEDTVATVDDMTVVLVIEERLEMRRVPWVVEEIRLRRRSVTKRKRVAEPVRRERVEISAEGDTEMKQR